MRPFTTLLLTIGITPIAFSQSWLETAPVPAAGRDDGIAFSVSGFGFVVTGNQGGFLESNKLWKYTPQSNDWTAMSDFPGTPRQYAGTFVLDGKAYVIMGVAESGAALSDVWQYDPLADQWTQLGDFPGKARWSFFAFATMTTGLIGTGTTSDSLLQDVWSYDPATDSWQASGHFPGGARREAVAFSIAEKGYVGLGYDTFGGSGFRSDFYSWNLLTESWTALPDFPGPGLAYATAVATDGVAYVGSGQDEAGNFHSEVCRYDPADAGWEPIASLPEKVRGMSAFTVDVAPVFITGLDDGFVRTSKGWMLDGTAQSAPETSDVYPNPSDGSAVVRAPNGSRIALLTPDGRVLSETLVADQHACLLTGLPKGSYYVRIVSASGSVSRLILVR